MLVNEVGGDDKHDRVNGRGYQGRLTGRKEALGAGRDGEQNAG